VAEEQDQEVEAAEGEQAEPPVEEEKEPQAESADEEEKEEESLDELEVLRQELEEAKAKEAEYLDGWQRARAELANARKRFQREQERSYTNAKANTLADFLPIVDDFERALGTLPEELSDEPWLEGIQLIQHKFQALMEKAGVAAIEAEDQAFDPFFHEAISHEPSDTVPAGHIIGELSKGYKMGDRVLRPSIVRVSAGPLPELEPEEEAADEEADASK
jgi:molecular chaperone GrpE